MIVTDFLQEIADYVDGRVAKVVLNGSYEITDFVKRQMVGQTLELVYIVPADEVPLIESVEVRDAADVALTSNAVYVPVTSDAWITHRIETGEGS